MNALRPVGFWIVMAGMLIFVIMTILACAGCGGTKEQRNALRTLTPISASPTLPVSASSPDLSPAARQIEALVRLQPVN
jgi:uncharacterized protein YcfL